MGLVEGDDMSNIIIRKATNEDAVGFVDLVTYVWRDAYKEILPEEVFLDMENRREKRIEKFSDRYYCGDDRICLMAFDNSKVVGIMFGRLVSGYPNFQEYSDLEALYIDPKYQGMGIGSRLKNEFISWAKEKGSSKFVIGVFKDNKKARSIYEAWGGILSEQELDFILLNVPYREVFYTYDLL